MITIISLNLTVSDTQALPKHLMLQRVLARSMMRRRFQASLTCTLNTFRKTKPSPKTDNPLRLNKPCKYKLKSTSKFIDPP